MFDISSGELLIVTGVAIALIGRKDLPSASRFVGFQVGRIVGLLQGARARADRFTTNTELKQLQNELRMGLRELDAVKSELAIATTQGLVGRELGRTTTRSTVAAGMGGAMGGGGVVGGTSAGVADGGGTVGGATLPVPAVTGSEYLAAASATEQRGDEGSHAPSSPLELAPRSHAVAAVAEEEWEKRGIGFKSRAEMGTGAWEGQQLSSSSSGNPSDNSNVVSGGSILLSDVMQQSLIYDQYDRAVREQDEILRNKLTRKLEERRDGGSKGDESSLKRETGDK